ncbi:MAG: restriction endonuclease subunit S [Pseudomonadota bacterium]
MQLADVTKDLSIELPVDWVIAPVDAYCNVIDPQPDHRAPALDPNGFPYIGIREVNKDGTVNETSARMVSEKAVLKQEKAFTIEPRDIVFCKIGTLGQPRHLNLEGKRVALSSTLVLIKAKKKCCERYLKHILDSDYMNSQIYRVITGATRPALGIQQIRKFRLPFPPLHIQKSISSFLDKKITQIDEAISIKEKQIALLKERKQIVIQNAVTQGLNPDVPMKDSGVDWIGEVPSRWSVRKLKYFTRFMGGGTPSKENMDYWGGDIPWVSPKDMKFDVIETSIDSITDLAVKKSSVKLVPTNSILIVVRGMILARKIPVSITAKKVTINQDMKALIVNENVCVPLFLRLILDGLHEELSTFLEESGHGTKTLPTEKLGGFLLPLPPISEQNKILEFVAKQSNTIEKTIKIQESQIDKLKEYKATLINSAVTGKIKVL